MLRRLQWISVVMIFILVIFSSVTFAESPKEIIVSAAADLSRAFKEIGAVYEKETGVKVLLNFGSTGLLAQQIEGGAPVDLFAAANKSYIDSLEGKGLILPETRKLYAVGRITLATPKSYAKLSFLQDLLRPEVKKIAIANPAHAPYGMAAKAAMEKIGIWKRLKDKLVLAENIRQTLDYVETGSVDAGIVALSVSIGSNTNFTLIPEELHPRIEQAMAVIKNGRNPKEAKGFADFINGPAGRPIMKKYGFVLPVGMK